MDSLRRIFFSDSFFNDQVSAKIAARENIESSWGKPSTGVGPWIVAPIFSFPFSVVLSVAFDSYFAVLTQVIPGC